jgi:hypothetical protein
VKSIYALVFAAAALVACSKKKDEGAGSAAAPPPVETGSATGSAGSGSDGSAAPVAEAPVDVPTEVDFETEATSDISDKNVEAKLKSLESELAQ